MAKAADEADAATHEVKHEKVKKTAHITKTAHSFNPAAHRAFALLACVQDESSETTGTMVEESATQGTKICVDYEPCKKTVGCSRMCLAGKKHRGMCMVNGKALKPDKMQTEDDEPKTGALGVDRVLRQKKHPMEKFLEDAESRLHTPQPKERPRQRGGARSAPESPVAIRVKQLLLVSLAASVKAPTDAAASANFDLHSQVSETASELAPAGFNYTKYVEAQRRKTDAIALSGHTGQWVVKETIQYIAKYAAEHLQMTRHFSLCHGTRSGREALWFRESLPGIQVWGTELSPVAAATAPWTMPWDFHEVRPEWRGAADFVYSNALDHSFNASLAVSSWLEELAPGGAILIHWAGGASKATGVHKDTDIFSAGYVRLMEIFSAVGNVTEVVSLPTPQKSWYGGRVKRGQKLFVVQAKAAT